MPVAADLARGGLGDAFLEGLIHGAHDELDAKFLGAAVAEFDQLGKFVAGLDIQERHGDVGWTERLFGEAQQTDGVFAAGKEQGRTFKLGGHFTHDVDGFRFQVLQMIQMIAFHELRATD